MNKIKALLCLLVLTVAGCVMDTQYASNDEANDLPYTFSQFTDIPIPDGSQMDLDRSMMFGRETDWMGKVTFYAPYNVSGVFDFYMEEMPKFNWKELTSVRGSNSVLTYSYNCRVATIQLISNGFRGGTTVIISMAPSPAKRCQRDTTDRNDGYSEQKTPAPAPVAQPTQAPAVPTSTTVTPDPSVQQQLPMQIQTTVTQPQNLPQAPVLVGPVNNAPNHVYNYQAPYSNNLMNTVNTPKAEPGSLGLGDASNMYYKSNSNGVGQPPKF